jgi:hypothetical protein
MVQGLALNTDDSLDRVLAVLTLASAFLLFDPGPLQFQQVRKRYPPTSQPWFVTGECTQEPFPTVLAVAVLSHLELESVCSVWPPCGHGSWSICAAHDPGCGKTFAGLSLGSLLLTVRGGESITFCHGQGSDSYQVPL